MGKTNKRLFAGAGIIVCKPGGEVPGESITTVTTKHADQVSALLFALKDVFECELDYFNKFEFYGRLADAANGVLSTHDDYEALRSAILDEACMIAAEMGSHLYFAYGSNMDVDQMADRCPKAIFVGTAALPDNEFALDSEGVATIVPSCGRMVYGVLWLIANSDECYLDAYEGVGTGCYRKATLRVSSDSGRIYPALVYISKRGPHDGITYRPDYLERIIESARRHGLDKVYIEAIAAK